MVGTRAARDRASLGTCLLDDQLGFLSCLILQRDGRLLRRDERRAQKCLELAIPDEVPFERLDLVREVGAFAPDVFEADRDLVQQIVDGRASVATKDAFRRLEMPDFNGCERHRLPFQKRSKMLFKTPSRM